MVLGMKSVVTKGITGSGTSALLGLRQYVQEWVLDAILECWNVRLDRAGLVDSQTLTLMVQYPDKHT